MLNLFQHLFNIIMNHFEKTGQFARFFCIGMPIIGLRENFKQ